MVETAKLGVGVVLLRLFLAATIGGIIGYERRLEHKAIGVSGMVLVALGSATYMLLAQYDPQHDPAAIGRVMQGLLQGIGFLGGAVIFRGGTDVHGIKTATAIWITGAIGLAAGIGYWLLAVLAGIITVLVLAITDIFPMRHRQSEAKAAQPGRSEPPTP